MRVLCDFVVVVIVVAVVVVVVVLTRSAVPSRVTLVHEMKKPAQNW
jgi:hypothetical protein